MIEEFEARAHDQSGTHVVRRLVAEKRTHGDMRYRFDVDIIVPSSELLCGCRLD
jgi:hypothetical protein